MTRYCSAATIFLVVTACHSAPVHTLPEPESSSSVQPTSASGPLSTAIHWTVEPSTQPQRYRSTTVAIIDLGNTGIATRDSALSTIDFSLSITREAKAASYSAIIEAFRATGGNRSPQNSTISSLPFPITGRITPGRSALDSIDCTSDVSSTIPVIQRALILSPTQLQKNMTWTDSTDMSICSGPVPVSLTAVRTYRVMGETKHGEIPAILLERQDRTVSAGEGTEGQHRLQIKSQGNGRSTILIDVQTGALIDMTTVNTTTVAVTTSGRTQQFVQNSREHVTRY